MCAVRANLSTCARCGRQDTRIAARRAEGGICFSCYRTDAEVVEASGRCGRIRMPVTRLDDGTPLCLRCWTPPVRRCDLCGREGPVSISQIEWQGVRWAVFGDSARRGGLPGLLPPAPATTPPVWSLRPGQSRRQTRRRRRARPLCRLQSRPAHGLLGLRQDETQPSTRRCPRLVLPQLQAPHERGIQPLRPDQTRSRAVADRPALLHLPQPPPRLPGRLRSMRATPCLGRPRRERRGDLRAVLGSRFRSPL